MIVGINIFSGSKDVLGRALTNPTHYNPKNPTAVSIKRGGLGEFSFLNNGIIYNDIKYVDVEEAYFALKTQNGVTKNNIILLTDLIKTKLTQYPVLIEEITKRGGVEFLNKCIHTYNAYDNPKIYVVNKSNKGWSSKSGNAFIFCLTEAYKKLTIIKKGIFD
jgi:hypothetical protein